MRKKQAVIIFSCAYLPLIGGAELAIKEITDRIDDLDFFLITARIRRSFPRRERVGNTEVFRMGIGMPFVDKILSPFLGVMYARRLVKTHDVICFWSMMVTFTSLASFFLKLFHLHQGVPILLTLQEGDSPYHIRRARFGLIGLSWRFALRFADHVQVISNYLADMARQYGYKGEISVVPNGVDFEKFKIHPVIRQGRFPMGSGTSSNNKPKIIITTSRLVYKNGIDTLIDAIAKVKERIPDIQCWILGDGSEKEKLKLQITNYKLQNNVMLFGGVPYEEVPNHLAKADIFVRPSRSEGLGTAFLEAIAAGVPIIGTSVGGIPDFLKDGETGLFARVDDANDLAGKIERLLEDGELRERLAENGRRLTEERYNWDSIAQTMYNIFCYSKKYYTPTSMLIATGIYPPDIGGPATYSRTIAEEFATRGLDVIIVTYGDPQNPKSQIPNPKQIPNSKFQIKKISRRWPKGLRHLMYFLSVLRHGRHTNVIYAQQPISEGLPAMIAAKVLRKKFVLKIVGDYAWEQGVQRFGVNDLLDDFLLARPATAGQSGGQKKHGGFVEFLRAIESFVARCADRVIVPSIYLAGVVAQWGVSREHIYVIPNAVEILDVLLPAKEEARRMLDISLDAKIIVSAGRLVPWKGFDVLIEHMPEVIHQEPTAQLIIIGSGPDRLKLESRIKSQELGNNVQLVGSVSRENVLLYLRAADVFVLNTAYEGFSHQLIEAMAAGSPVITTTAGGNAEIVRDGENALVVPYNDRGKITQAILRVMRERTLQATLAKNGRKTAAQYTKSRMIEETLNALR